MCIVWPVMSLRVCMPWVRTWLCSPSKGAAAANDVFPDAAGEKPLVGGGISATLLMEFFSSPSDFSACCSLAQILSQSFSHCQRLPCVWWWENARTSRGKVTVPPWIWTMPFEKSCPFCPKPKPMLMRFAGGCDSLGGW
jgi:hypothetical protein